MVVFLFRVASFKNSMGFSATCIKIDNHQQTLVILLYRRRKWNDFAYFVLFHTFLSVSNILSVFHSKIWCMRNGMFIKVYHEIDYYTFAKLTSKNRYKRHDTCQMNAKLLTCGVWIVCVSDLQIMWNWTRTYACWIVECMNVNKEDFRIIGERVTPATAAMR